MIRKLVGGLLFFAAFSVAQGAVITIEGTSTGGPDNCIPFGCPGAFAGHAGFIYKNLPAFSVVAGDVLAFDLGAQNDVAISMTISLAPTMVNGGTTASGSFVTIATNATPAAPRGDDIKGNYELAFTVASAFDFKGGGLIIDFLPTGAFAVDTTLTQVLMFASGSDPSGFFVGRYYQSPAAGGANAPSDSAFVGNFRITTNAVPEPGSIALLAFAMAALAFARRRSG